MSYRCKRYHFVSQKRSQAEVISASKIVIKKKRLFESAAKKVDLIRKKESLLLYRDTLTLGSMTKGVLNVLSQKERLQLGSLLNKTKGEVDTKLDDLNLQCEKVNAEVNLTASQLSQESTNFEMISGNNKVNEERGFAIFEEYFAEEDSAIKRNNQLVDGKIAVCSLNDAPLNRNFSFDSQKEGASTTTREVLYETLTPTSIRVEIKDNDKGNDSYKKGFIEVVDDGEVNVSIKLPRSRALPKLTNLEERLRLRFASNLLSVNSLKIY
jgi:hypothetical protein